jgi:cell division protein FtsN
LPLRETRRFKTKGVVRSFGDFMLPVVAVVALVLLVIAGWRFFFSGPSALTPYTPLTQELSDGPTRRQESNQAEAGTQTHPIFPRPAPAESAPVSSRRVLEMDPLAVPMPVEGRPYRSASSASRQTAPVSPAARTPSRPAKEQPAPQRAIPRQVATTPAPRAVVAQTQTQTKLTGWMVQVGAFSNRAAAEAVLQRFLKAGYTAAVTSTQTLHRVLVQAGSTREAAESLAARLGQSGYQGAFIVPPRQ